MPVQSTSNESGPGVKARLVTWGNDWWQLLLVVVTAAAARVLYWVLAVPTYFPISDADQYWQLGRNVADGTGFQLVFPANELHATAFRPPLYPYLLGGALKVFGVELDTGRRLSVILGVITAGLTYLLVRRIAGAIAALVAGMVVALYPPLLANDTFMLTEPLSLTLLVGMLLALSHRRWDIGGLLCGLLILSRPSAQFILVVVAVWILWQLGWKRALGFAAVAVVVVSPWVIRNWVVMGSPVLVTSNGFNAAAMYSPAANEDDGFVNPVYDPRFAEYQGDMADEAQWQADLQRLAFRSIRDDPWQVPRVMGRNALSYFELQPSTNTTAEEFDGRNMDFRSATLPAFYVVTVVGLVGLALQRRRPMVVLVIALAAYFALSSLVFVAPPRLRAPFDLCCCIGVGLAVGWWLDRRRRAGNENIGLQQALAPYTADEADRSTVEP